MAPSRRKTPGLPGALRHLPVLVLLAAAPVALAKYQNNFDLYPAAAQPCLYAASDASRCDGDTVATMNKCLCSDDRGGFVTSSAVCIGRDARATLRTVYQSMSTACSDSKSPIALTEDQFLALGARGATASSLPVTPSATPSAASSSSASRTTFLTTTTGGATVTVTSAPRPSQSSSSSGLSTTAKIGVGVGAGVGVAALLGLAAFIWRLKRSRDTHDDPPASVGGTPYVGAAQEYKSENKQAGWRPASTITQSTSPGPGSGGVQTWATNSPHPSYAQPQQHAWGHHPQAAYAYVPPPQQQQQHQQQGGVFELASIPVASPPQTSQPHPPDAVEMPATEVQPRPARYQYPS
ncbi:hypothetical protein LZ32DRAFT_641159 [Colletotrichum eremochloae]|nr:hypothetical protein LZ32DRAFT_641159 [Colletotrichum eremochloae]